MCFSTPAEPAAPSTKGDKRGQSQNNNKKKKKKKKKNKNKKNKNKKNKNKNKKNKKKGDRSRLSSRGSKASRGSQSLKDKGGKPSSSGSAAVCLMRALMMVAVINPSTSTRRVPEGIASRELHGKPCKCNFACDCDIGCRHCIRSDLNALPGHMPSQQRNASAEIAWIADNGSAQDLVCSKMIPEDLVYHSHEPLEFIITANGSQSADQQCGCCWTSTRGMTGFRIG